MITVNRAEGEETHTHARTAISGRVVRSEIANTTTTWKGWPGKDCGTAAPAAGELLLQTHVPKDKEKEKSLEPPATRVDMSFVRV